MTTPRTYIIMELDNASFGVDTSHFEGQSYGGESRTTTGSSSMRTIDEAGGGTDTVELPRGLCRVIYTYGRATKDQVEIICGNRYGRCDRKGHRENQKDDGRRGQSGWYIGVYSKSNKLVGGLLGTHMDAAKARELRESHRNSNRKSATQRVGSSSKTNDKTPVGGPESNRTTPESGGGTSWVDPVTGQAMGPSYQAVGKAILDAGEIEGKENRGATKTLREVTERIVGLQQTNPNVIHTKYREGDQVGYRRGGRITCSS